MKEGLRKMFESFNESENYTELYYSCSIGNTKAVDMLLHNGQDVNYIECNQDTALHVACKNGHINILKMLLENNALCRKRQQVL